MYCILDNFTESVKTQKLLLNNSITYTFNTNYVYGNYYLCIGKTVIYRTYLIRIMRVILITYKIFINIVAWSHALIPCKFAVRVLKSNLKGMRILVRLQMIRPFSFGEYIVLTTSTCKHLSILIIYYVIRIPADVHFLNLESHEHQFQHPSFYKCVLFEDPFDIRI